MQIDPIKPVAGLLFYISLCLLDLVVSGAINWFQRGFLLPVKLLTSGQKSLKSRYRYQLNV